MLKSRVWLFSAAVLVALLAPGVAFAASPDWTQVDQRVEGEAVADGFGRSVAISDDGATIAVGAPRNDDGASSAGHVRVFRNDGEGWSQLGADIDGDQFYELFGLSVAMNGDGSSIIVGTPYSDTNGRTAGRARVYGFNDGQWTQTGSSIDGDNENDWMGRSVAMTSDGLTIAVSATQAAGTRGHVKVLRFVDGDWTQVGEDIVGKIVNDWLGTSVELSADGQTVAIGAAESDSNGYDSGQVSVHRFDGDAWTQLGTDIDGENERDWFGFALAMSADGMSLIAGAPWNDAHGPQTGHARVYQFDGADWAQVGATIEGESANDYAGWSVAMSDDALTIATSRPRYDGFRNNAGQTQVYGFDGLEWVAVGSGIDGKTAGEYSGASIALTGDASTIAIGAPQQSASPGFVDVYALGEGDGGGDEPTESLQDGDVVFLTNVASGRYLDGDGVNRFWNVDTSPTGRFDARWQLEDNGDGTWSLLNRRRTRYLDADGPKSDFDVRQSVEVRADDKWELIAGEDGAFTVRNEFYDRYLHEDALHNVNLVTAESLDDAARWNIAPVD